MSRQGYLLIADLTGYTTFLTKSELEHAQGILEAIFKSMLGEIKTPLAFSNLQGDAILAYAPDERVPQGQLVLDALERIYCSFADTLTAMQRNTTCTCNACRNMAELDLKFFVHHGSYMVQVLAGRDELQGPDVIRVHRLLKNTVTRATGLRAYALVTEAAAKAIRLPEFFSGVAPHLERSDDFGETPCFVYDLRPIWERRRMAQRVTVSRDEPLAMEPLECDLPMPPSLTWAYLVDAGNQMRWRKGLDGITMTVLDRGRVGPGSVQHCAHGKQTTIHNVVDWQPFDYVTYHIVCPFGTVVRQMVDLTPTADGGTHVSLRCARPEGKSRLGTALVRFMVRLGAGKLEGLQRASKTALEGLVAEEVASGRAVRAPAPHISPSELSAAAVTAITAK